MDKDKQIALIKREKVFDHVYYMVLGIVTLVVVFYMYHFHDNLFSKDPNDWGVFGDFFGGTLNPLLAFFSFMLLLLNLKLQREQLDKTEEQLELNREELKLTREELRKAADAQVDSAKVMNEQVKTQALQQFESLYLYSLDQLSLLSKKIDHDRLDSIVKNKIEPPEKFGKIKNDIGVDHDICAYRDYLVLILKRLDRMDIADSEKYDYFRMITASYSKGLVFALHISFYYLLVSQDDEILDVDLHQLLTKYNFFKNLELIDFGEAEFTYHSIGLTKALGDELYKNNQDFKEIVKSTMYTDIREYYSETHFSVYVKSLFKRFSIGDGNMEINFQSPNILEVKISEKIRTFKIGVDGISIMYESLTITSIENSSLNLIIRLGAESAELSLDGDVWDFRLVRKST